MSLSAAQAAAAVGMTKAGIIKALREGRISGQKDRKGEWRIEPVELFRVYPPVNAVNGNGHPPVDSVGTEVDASTHQYIAGYQREMAYGPSQTIELLREMMRDKDDVISDLRRRLDTQTDETQRLTALLQAMTPPAAAPRTWWARLLGRGATAPAPSSSSSPAPA